MHRSAPRFHLVVTLLMLVSFAATADELTLSSILISHKAGAPAERLVAIVNDPANTIALRTEDLATLRSAGVHESVIAAVQARLAAAPPAAPAMPEQVTPDDPRLIDIVRLVKSGISEPIIAEQVKHSGESFKLSVNDLLYLKQNEIQESIISVLLAARVAEPSPEEVAAAATPKEIVFNDLLLVRGFLKKDRPGRLILKGETFSWVDGADPKQSFDFQISGLEKIWYTCQPQTPENVCYQINFKIVKGVRHSFVDVHRATGSNATVAAVMEHLREAFPRAPFGSPDH